MKVMVTGGTGFTGSHTVRALLDAGHRVRLLVRDREKVRRVFEPSGVVPDEVVVGDIVDEASVNEAMKGCDAVFHAAALVDLRRSMAERVLATNARGVELVVGGAVRRGLPSIVHVSSLSVFFHPGAPPLHPGLPIQPGTTAYARSKAQAEHTVRRWQDEGAPIRISYPAGIVGPDDPGLTDSNGAVCAWFRDTGILTSSGFQAVDVRDVAALHRLQLEWTAGPRRDAAAAEFLPWARVYELMDQLTGARVRRFPVSGAAMRFLGSVGDVVKHVIDFSFPLTRDSMEFATQWPGADASRTTAELGLAFRPVAETYRDTLRWLYRAGHLREHHVGRLALG